MLKFGIEQEIIFKTLDGNYIDFKQNYYHQFKKIIDTLPVYPEDKYYFNRKSIEKYPKRWYLEGFERFDKNSKPFETIPKGIEIRTSPHNNIKTLVDEFRTSFNSLKNEAIKFDLEPVLISFNPYQKQFQPIPKLQPHELDLRTKEEYTIASNSMLSHGMHVSLSIQNSSEKVLEDIVKKINYYTPYILPFSFSSPFFNNDLFEGLSYRTYIRANRRKLTHIREINNTKYIEFKGFDACGDTMLLTSLIVLMKYLVLDKELKDRSSTQNIELLQKSAMYGFNSEIINDGILQIIDSISKIVSKEELPYIEYLKKQVKNNQSYSMLIKQNYNKTNNILKSISNLYNF